MGTRLLTAVGVAYSLDTSPLMGVITLNCLRNLSTFTLC